MIASVCLTKWEEKFIITEGRKIKKMSVYAMWHVPHHPPFLEMFERSCAAGAGGSGGTGGAGISAPAFV